MALLAVAAYPIIIPKLKVAPRTSYGNLKNLLVVGYKKTNGVTTNPSFTHSGGKLNSTPKLMAINPVKNAPAYFGEISPVVSGLAFVLSTCLSISLSAKSLIMHPADLQLRAPKVNNDMI